MVIFHWILHTPMHPEHQTPILSPALSLDNLLLLLLCTPVQVSVFIQHLTRTWKGHFALHSVIALARKTEFYINPLPHICL